jgi:Arc/MetJ-type ribon-helix-helix transcriptional regulator
MKVTLTEELKTLVKEKVRSGRYADESEVNHITE